jgi:hypothetical protein
MGNLERKKRRVFRNTFITSNMLVTKIKDEAAMWSLAGANALSSVMTRELAFMYRLGYG